MMPARRYTIEEYVALEDASPTKNEYLDGEIIPWNAGDEPHAMAGASATHNAIALNLGALLRVALRGRPCRPYPSDQRVHVVATRFTAYPDVSVFCGQPTRHDGDREAFTSPVVLAEVLSPSTEKYDRGPKWRHYMRIPTLREYLLVSQDEPRIERFSLGPTGWLYEVYEGTAVVPIGALDVTLPLSEVYADLPDE